MSHDQPQRWAVIGGGISGLAACHRLVNLSRSASRPVAIDLFESSDRLGGVFGTIEQDGYLLETGADMFITNKPAALELSKELGLSDRLIETDKRFRKSLILRRGRPLPTPVGFDLMAPRDLGAFLRTKILSPAGKARVLREYFIRPQPQDDESLSSFARRRFGREAFERMIQPMIGGIYTADPDKLGLRSTLPRFLEMEAEHGSVLKGVLKEAKKSKARRATAESQASGARYGLFLSFDRGMSVLQDALVEAIQEDVQIRSGTPVTNVSKTVDGQWGVTTQGQTEGYDAVILAVPSHVAAGMLQDSLPELTASLQRIEYASAAIVLTGYRLDQIQHDMKCFGLVIPAIEQRKILAVSCTSRKFPKRAPEGRIQLRTFIGGALQQQLLKQSDEELTELACGELEQIFGIQGEPELTRVVRWNGAMPQYHVGHQQRIAEIEQRFSGQRGLELAGNSLHGVGLPDVIQTAWNRVEQSWRELNAS